MKADVSRMAPMSEPTLLIDDGGLAGLVACALHPAPDRLVIWSTPRTRSAEGRAAVNDVIRRRAEAYGVRTILDADDAGTGVLRSTWILLSACETALTQGCSLVLWPAHAGDDVRTMSAEADRARLISFLVAVDAGSGGSGSAGNRPRVRIETPYLDLRLAQLCDLAVDADLPLGEGWWVEEDAAAVQRAIREARGRRGWVPA